MKKIGYKNYHKYFHATFSWEWFYQIDAWIREFSIKKTLTRFAKRVYNKVGYDIKGIQYSWNAVMEKKNKEE
jgi:hypothetical protein